MKGNTINRLPPSSKCVYDFFPCNPLPTKRLRTKIVCTRHGLLWEYVILTALLCSKNEIKFPNGKK